MRIPDETVIIERGQQGRIRWEIGRITSGGLVFSITRDGIGIRHGAIPDGSLKHCHRCIYDIIDKINQEDSEEYTGRRTIVGWKRNI